MGTSFWCTAHMMMNVPCSCAGQQVSEHYQRPSDADFGHQGAVIEAAVCLQVLGN